MSEVNQEIDKVRIQREQDAANAGGMSDFIPIQAVSLAIQDQVSVIQNLSTITNTAMGSAYSKWLSFPGNDQYETIISSIKETNKVGRWDDLRDAINVIKELKEAQSFTGDSNKNQSNEKNNT